VLALYFKESYVFDFPLALLAMSKRDIGFINENMTVYRLMSESYWSNTMTNEHKILNNENVRMTIEKFHKETNNQFVETTKELSKNVYYHYGLYYCYKTPFKKMLFIAENFFKRVCSNPSSL
jgi:hypothetical protein